MTSGTGSRFEGELNLTQQVLGLVGWLILSGIVAWFGSQFSPGPWYESLEKPAWTPPGWVFGVVWPILYTLMAVAVWLVWRRGGFVRNRLPLSVYGVQLLFNAFWLWLFFVFKDHAWALIDLILLLVAVASTLVLFWRRSLVSGILLTPYLIWLLYALSLNGWIWANN